MKKNIPSPYGEVKPLYTFDQMKEVWYFAMIQGASLWQYSQDKKRNLPDDFNKGLNGVRENIADPSAMQLLLGSNVVLFGLYDECIDIDKVTPTISVTQTTRKKRTKNPPNSEDVK